MTAWFGVALLLTGCRADPEATEPVAIEVAPGELHVPTRTLDFGTVALADSAQQDLVLSNVGTGTLYIHDLQLSDDGLRVHWTLGADVQQELAPGETLLVPVFLAPRDVVDPTVVLTVVSSDPATPRITVELTAQVAGVPVLRLNPDALDFGDVQVGQSKTLDVVLSNLGNDTLTIDSLTLDAQDGYSLAIDPSGSRLDPGQSNGLASVAYAPEDQGGHTGLLTFSSNDPARPEITVLLTGTGE